MAQPSIYDIKTWSSASFNIKRHEIVEHPANSHIYYYALKDHQKSLSDFTINGYNSEKWTKAEVGINGVTTKHFIWSPSYSTTMTQQPRLKIVRFGVGVEHRAQDGINTNLLNYDLQFLTRDVYETTAILHFLHQRAGVESFAFNPPKPFMSNKMFVCEQWETQTKPREHFDIRAIFRQVKPEPYQLTL